MNCQVFPEMDEMQLESFPSKAEASFYRACKKHLDPRCLVIHSLSLIASSNKLGNQVAECDFLIIHPEFGILAVEVKGGGIEFDPQHDGEWYSTGRDGHRVKIKDPFQQSVSTGYKALNLIKTARGIRNRKLSFGHTVAFPDISVKQLTSLLGHNRPREIVACFEDLKDLNKWYLKAVTYWRGQETSFDQLQKIDIEEIKRLLLKPVFASPSVANLLDREEERRIRLTEEQLALVRFLQHQKRANIIGGAGTGKTVLALHLAENFAAEGKRTLLLCFNRPLGDNLYNATIYKENIEAGSFHSFFQNKMGEKFEGYLTQAMDNFPEENIWDIVRPYAYTLFAEEEALNYDAVIIDEAQDFAAEAWMPLETLVSKEDTIMFTFSDTNQKFYSKVDNIPYLSPPYPLSQNCRNTRSIHEVAYTNYIGPTVNPPLIDGAPIEEHSGVTEREQLNTLIHLLDKLVAEGGITPHDITILTANSEHFRYNIEELQKHTKKYRFELSEIPARGSIRVSTIKKFKGLEALVLIIWGLNDVSKFERDELHYVGISRAKSLCFLIN